MSKPLIQSDAFDDGIDNATHAALEAFEGVVFEGATWLRVSTQINDALTGILSQEMEIIPK